MIVCVCNNISEKKIHHAVDAGMGDEFFGPFNLVFVVGKDDELHFHDGALLPQLFFCLLDVFDGLHHLVEGAAHTIGLVGGLREPVERNNQVA